MILLAGCPEIEPVPEIPEIEFVSFTLSEDTDDLGNLLVVGELIFSFQDGDGDIGLQEPDTVMPGDTTVYNLFFTMFKKIGGEYFEISEDDLGSPLNYRIPYIEPREGQNKILTGEINILFEYPNIQYDTIRYDFFITDRAMHKSNVESTPDIGLTEWKD
ncbi:MAG: hypothetical protein AMS27_12455 [Bacteroides sp. SM23_62_1]|nr:MAG: hypothetical protein AMS27_12455 [Bacteroides sp. SM23_62_1]